MNKIFKVIWSKSKQCYVVVSEMAKNTTGKKKIVVAGILASLAVTTNIIEVDAAGRFYGNAPAKGIAISTTDGVVQLVQMVIMLLRLVELMLIIMVLLQLVVMQ